MEAILRNIFFSVLLFLILQKGYSDNFSVKEYFLDIIIREDLFSEFHETLIVNYPDPRHGIVRTLADRVIDIQGNNPVRILNSKKYYVLRFGSKDILLDGQKKYSFSYRSDSAAGIEGNRLHFEWPVIERGWNAPVEKIRISLSFPDSWKIKMSGFNLALNGMLAPEEFLDIRRDKSQLIIETQRPLDPGDRIQISGDFILENTVWIPFYRNWFSAISAWLLSLQAEKNQDASGKNSFDGDNW